MDENSSARLKRRLLGVVHRIGLFLAMLTICLPGLWIVLSSLRPTVEIMAKPPVWIPQEISFDAYIAMFSGIGKGGIPVIEYFRNSLWGQGPQDDDGYFLQRYMFHGDAHFGEHFRM